MNEKALKALQEVNTMFKDNQLMIVLGESQKLDIERTETGFLSIDAPFGGGVPDGRIIELYGGESSGKTTISLHMLASYQQKHKDRETAFIDFEHAFDKKYARNLGVDVDSLIISQPMYAEQGLQAIITLTESGGYSCIVVDSVAAMSPEAEIKGEVGKSTIGVHARLMSQSMRKLAGIANKTNTTVIFINQLREKIGVMFGNPNVTTGGNALKFYASIRAEIFRGQKNTDSDKELTGNRGRIKIVKNKTFPPYRESEFDINFGEGIDRVGDILDYAVEAGFVKKSGSWFSVEDTKIGQGRNAAKDVLKDNPDLTEELYKRIVEILE